MTAEANQPPTSRAVTASAIFLAVLGLAFLFAGQEMSVSVLGRNDVEPFASLLGAAWFGFGALNWVARRSTLGGVYGRALVVGNEVHFLVGALVLLKHAVTVSVTAMFLVLTFFYVLGALMFGYLLLGSGIRKP